MDTKKTLDPVEDPLPHDMAEGEIIDTIVKHNSPNDALAAALEQYQPGTKQEKRLLLKIDLFLIPMLWLMCVLAYVDRNNIANADAAGLGDDLDLSDNDYAMVIAIFFVAYVLFEVPSNLLLARCRPSWYLSSIMMAWGTLVCGMSQVKSYRSLLIIRFFLGIIESGFFPGVLYLMTCWYKRYEIGKRFSIFFTALCFAGAASGLISGAVISGLEGVRGMRGWRWLFLIEGLLTIAVALVSIFVLADYPETISRRLNEEERTLAVIRIMHDKKSSATQHGRLTAWQGVKAAAVDLRTYFFIILYMTQNGSTTISYFLPTILKGMGYTGAKAQWMTVPIWATSDRLKNRQWHVVFGLSVAFISAIVCITVDWSDATRYAMVCFYIAGLYMTLPLILNWASELMSLPSEKRAVVIGMVNCFGSISSIYGSYLWPSSDAPRYLPGFITVSTFMGFGIVLGSTMPLIFRHLPKFPTKAERELAQLEIRDEERRDQGLD
ncbi:unnamed protein product [Penicillium glandicola]